MTDENRIPKHNESPMLVKEEHYVDDLRQFEIAQLGQRALTTTDLNTFMLELVKLVSKSLSTEFVNVLKLTEDGKQLKLIQGVGWHEGIVGDFLINVDYSSQAGYTLINKKPVIVTNFANEKRFNSPQLLIDHNITSGISITIPGKDKPFGILGAHSKRPIDFTVNDINFLHSATYILSSAITQQEAITRLKEEEEKYRSLMEFASDAIFIANAEGKYINVNGKACEITGYTRDELLQMKPEDLFPAEDIIKNPLKFKNELGDENYSIFERRIIRKDKTILPVEVSLSYLPNGEYQAICRDLSKRRETEELLRTAQKMEAIGRVTGGIAHDFNNYLTIITGYSDKIINQVNKGNFSNTEIAADASQIRKTSDTASGLIRQLLTFSRKKHLIKENIDVNKIIKDLEKSFKSFLGEKIKLTFNLTEPLTKIRAHPDLLQQSILNLVINGKDAIEQNYGEITLETFEYTLDTFYQNYAFNALPGDYIAISITDSGLGMSDEIKSHIFEPFFTTKAPDKGTGLGLASIYGFIKEYGGFITVDSELQKGSTITLFLKASSESNDSAKVEQENRIIKKTKGVKTILLVEDNKELLELLEKTLVYNSFTVIKAHNGIEALQILDTQEAKIDLIISDVVMPEMDGFEMLNTLEDMKIFKKTIFISGYSLKDPMTIKYSQEVTFLPKPFSIDVLISSINKID